MKIFTNSVSNPAYVPGVTIIALFWGVYGFIHFTTDIGFGLLFTLMGLIVAVPFCIVYCLIVRLILFFFRKSNLRDGVKALLINVPLAVFVCASLVYEVKSNSSEKNFERFIAKPIPPSVQKLRQAWIIGPLRYWAFEFSMPTGEAKSLFERLGYRLISEIELQSDEKHEQIRAQELLKATFKIVEWNTAYMRTTEKYYEFAVINSEIQIGYVRLWR